METIGYHYVVEAAGCDRELLAAPDRIREIFTRACSVGEMQLKSTYFFRFSPKGVSGVAILAESHISVHTWPDHGYAALDVYVCGERSEPERAIDHILEELRSSHAHISELKRGIEDDHVYTHAILTWEEEM